MFRDEMTLFNKYYDRSLEHDVYLRSYVNGVSWQGSQEVSVTDRGLLINDYTDVYIPTSVNVSNKIYLQPTDWDKSIDKANHFTFKPDDIIIKGTIDYFITTTTRELFEMYNEVLTVLSVVDFTDTDIPHWKLSARR